jgi:hypothetical protein
MTMGANGQAETWGEPFYSGAPILCQLFSFSWLISATRLWSGTKC